MSKRAYAIVAPSMSLIISAIFGVLSYSLNSDISSAITITFVMFVAFGGFSLVFGIAGKSAS